MWMLLWLFFFVGIVGAGVIVLGTGVDLCVAEPKVIFGSMSVEGPCAVPCTSLETPLCIALPCETVEVWHKLFQPYG